MKKLKQHYRHPFMNRKHVDSWYNYDYMRSGTHKRFSTKQEKSLYFLHKIEYRDYPLKLRAARGKALADPWDDYPSSVNHVAKSWKHNSKRHQQYYQS